MITNVHVHKRRESVSKAPKVSRKGEHRKRDNKPRVSRIRRLVGIVGMMLPTLVVAGMITGWAAVSYGGSFDGLPYTQLPACPTDSIPEDGLGYDCYWNADTTGNEGGRSFWATERGWIVYVDSLDGWK